MAAGGEKKYGRNTDRGKAYRNAMRQELNHLRRLIRHFRRLGLWNGKNAPTEDAAAHQPDAWKAWMRLNALVPNDKIKAIVAEFARPVVPE